MEKWKNKIYPSELLLTSDDKCDQEVNFLDLHLEIKTNTSTIAYLINVIIFTFLLLTFQA